MNETPKPAKPLSEYQLCQRAAAKRLREIRAMDKEARADAVVKFLAEEAKAYKEVNRYYGRNLELQALRTVPVDQRIAVIANHMQAIADKAKADGEIGCVYNNRDEVASFAETIPAKKRAVLTKQLLAGRRFSAITHETHGDLFIHKLFDLIPEGDRADVVDFFLHDEEGYRKYEEIAGAGSASHLVQNVWEQAPTEKQLALFARFREGSSFAAMRPFFACTMEVHAICLSSAKDCIAAARRFLHGTALNKLYKNAEKDSSAAGYARGFIESAVRAIGRIPDHEKLLMKMARPIKKNNPELYALMIAGFEEVLGGPSKGNGLFTAYFGLPYRVTGGLSRLDKDVLLLVGEYSNYTTVPVEVKGLLEKRFGNGTRWAEVLRDNIAEATKAQPKPSPERTALTAAKNTIDVLLKARAPKAA